MKEVSCLLALEIRDLIVEVDGRRVLDKVNLEVPEGELHVLFGPNGSGKTSLILTILGFPRYKVVHGEIIFMGEDITSLPVNERVKKGLGVIFQNPPQIPGVRLGDVLERLAKGQGETPTNIARRVNFPTFYLERELNRGFSGGEIKRCELMQLIAQKPKFLLLDEPDSGVDVENLEIIGGIINELARERSGILITHLGYILRYVEAHKAHVVINGKIACSGRPIEILDHILREGYWWCDKCRIMKERGD
ncbi:MAG: ABC transporter ATP-binding protein [Candidatus Freyarchaeota archaeon]